MSTRRASGEIFFENEFVKQYNCWGLYIASVLI